jgi:hypothetical protein
VEAQEEIVKSYGEVVKTDGDACFHSRHYILRYTYLDAIQ